MIRLAPISIIGSFLVDDSVALWHPPPLGVMVPPRLPPSCVAHAEIGSGPMGGSAGLVGRRCDEGGGGAHLGSVP